MYAVVAIQWHQYLVKKWDELIVDQMIDEKEGAKVTFDNVLLTFDKDGWDVKIGTPVVDGAVVTAKVVAHQQGEKMRVIKFQGKKRYKRTKWFRPQQTILSIQSV